MNDRFRPIFDAWDQSDLGGFEAARRHVEELLREHGIRLRQDDGELFQINWSLPWSRQSVVVLGARYEKRDGSHTEDCFVFTPGPSSLDVVPQYRGSIERELGECRRTHKRYVDAFDPEPLSSPHAVASDCRTITFMKCIG